MDVHGVGGRDAQDLGLKVSGARAYTVTQCAVASPIGLISPQLMSKNDARRKKEGPTNCFGNTICKILQESLPAPIFSQRHSCVCSGVENTG